MLSYAITSSKTLQNIKNNPDIVLYRDKLNSNYNIDAKEFLKNAKSLGFQKSFLHGNYELAYELQADGIHLRSDQLLDIAKAKELKLFVVVSTHSIKEAKMAQELGADMVTFSPIFQTVNKGKPVGIQKLKELVDLIDIPVIALGGILTKSDIQECEAVGAHGFASIRYFLV